MKLSTLASSSILYVFSLERNAGKVCYNFYHTFLLMYFVSSVILQCVAVNYSIQAFKTMNVSVCVCCGLILSLVQFFCLFVCFWVWQCITMNLKQKKIKFKPRINLNHNIYKKHIATCEVLRTVYTHSLFLYQKSNEGEPSPRSILYQPKTHLVNLM